jgi:dsDNA-specific endonuclease/ATPase MutS2
MENLIQNLQRTIRALETLSERALPEAEQVDELLDQLFQQKTDLLNVNVNVSSSIYQQASQALNQAATRAEKAIKDPSHLEELINLVNDAIAKVTKLLNNMAI